MLQKYSVACQYLTLCVGVIGIVKVYILCYIPRPFHLLHWGSEAARIISSSNTCIYFTICNLRCCYLIYIISSNILISHICLIKVHLSISAVSQKSVRFGAPQHLKRSSTVQLSHHTNRNSGTRVKFRDEVDLEMSKPKTLLSMLYIFSVPCQQQLSCKAVNPVDLMYSLNSGFAQIGIPGCL